MRALRQAADAQLVVLTRCGGQGVQDLDTDWAWAAGCHQSVTVTP